MLKVVHLKTITKYKINIFNSNFIQRIHIVPTQRGGKKIIFKGYEYTIKGEKNGTVFLRCKDRKCKGSASASVDISVVKECTGHEHLPNPNLLLLTEKINALKADVRTRVESTVQQCYKQFLIQLRRENGILAVIFPSFE